MSEDVKFQVIYKEEGINLSDFALSISSFDKQYNRFLGHGNKKNKPKLHISKISEGSIEIDFCEIAEAVSLVDISSLKAYYDSIVSTLNWLNQGRTANPKIHECTKRDYENYKGLVSSVIYNINNSMLFSLFNFGSITINNSFGCRECRKITEECNKGIAESKKPGNIIYQEAVKLLFSRAVNSALLGNKENKAIIYSVSNKPQSVVFTDSNLEYRIIKGENNPLNFEYTVDVNIHLSPGCEYIDKDTKIIKYEIIAFRNLLLSPRNLHL